MNEHINSITALFERQFSDAYLKTSGKKRKQIFPFLSMIYRRWYYSALVEATPLTPANMVASVGAAHGRGSDVYPSAALRSTAKWAGLHFNVLEYSAEKHPVADDLRAVVAYCSPSIDLFDEDCFCDEQAIEIGNQLSLRDPHYASYLLEVAFRMKLLIKIPSIYANLTQAAKDSRERLAASDASLLEEIIETTIKLAAFSLSQMLPLPEPVFTETFIRNLLKEPMITDDIFECVYDTLGFSLEDLFEGGLQDEFEDFDETFLSGTFVTGVMLDKFFFTPFSYFLKLIRPIYVLPFDFVQEFKYFVEAPDDGEELATSFYAPCSKYFFTELGLKVFNIKATPETYADAASFMPYDDLKNNLLTKAEMMDRLPVWAHEPLPEGFPFPPVSGRAFTFKIKLTAEPAYWIQLELGEETTLHRLYTEITRYFYFTRNDDYSFFHGEVETPFTEYASSVKAKRAKNTSDIPLSELDFAYSGVLMLIVHNQGDENRRQAFRLRIDFMGEKPKTPRLMYPALIKMSKSIRLLHEEDGDDFI